MTNNTDNKTTVLFNPTTGEPAKALLICPACDGVAYLTSAESGAPAASSVLWHPDGSAVGYGAAVTCGTCGKRVTVQSLRYEPLAGA